MVKMRIHRSLKDASFYPDRRHETPVEFAESIRSQPIDLSQHLRRIVKEPSHVDALTARRERREVPGPAREHIHRAMVIAPAQVVEGDADLEDPLVQVPDVATFGAP
jgi:hypothetical protein